MSIKIFFKNSIKKIIRGALRDIILYGCLLISVVTMFFGDPNRLFSDRVLGFFIVLGLLGILRILGLAIDDAISKEKNLHGVLKVSILIAVIFTFFIEAIDFTRPIVSSGLIEFNYDLTNSDTPFLAQTTHGTFTIKKISNDTRYEIHFPHKIVEIKNLVSESSLTKQRMNWVEHIDFDTREQYIESRHQLNLHANEWKKGRFLISYKYRLNFMEYLMHPKKIILNKIFG